MPSCRLAPLFRWAALIRVLAVADIRRRVRFTFRIPRAERSGGVGSRPGISSNAAGDEPKSNQSEHLKNRKLPDCWTEGLLPTAIGRLLATAYAFWRPKRFSTFTARLPCNLTGGVYLQQRYARSIAWFTYFPQARAHAGNRRSSAGPSRCRRASAPPP